MPGPEMLGNASLPKGGRPLAKHGLFPKSTHPRSGSQGGRLVELVHAMFIQSLSSHKPTHHISLFWVGEEIPLGLSCGLISSIPV